jgi:AbrB family looped-hinge helix DNA binding protein
MEDEVIVTRKGQTTIPIRFRTKYNIEEGTRLQVVDTNDGILMRPKKSTLDLAGSGARFASPEEMKRLLEKIRDLDA